MKILLVFFLCAFLKVYAHIFEALKSEDVDYFLDNDESQYRGVLFYDPELDDESTIERVEQLMSIFDDPNDPEFQGESWIRELQNGDFKTGANMMRVDATKPSLSKVVSEYEVNSTPKIILFDGFKIMIEELFGRKTYSSIKDEITGGMDTSDYSSSQNTATISKPATGSEYVAKSDTEGSISIGSSSQNENRQNEPTTPPKPETSSKSDPTPKPEKKPEPVAIYTPSIAVSPLSMTSNPPIMIITAFVVTIANSIYDSLCRSLTQ